MTTIEAAGRLARHLKGGDFTKLTVSELADVLGALNYGSQRLYTLLPERFRATPVSVAIAAPETVSAVVTEGSPDLGNSPFSVDDVGKSVVVDGDANWNEVTGLNALMDAYLGSTGTKNAIVYSDSLLDASYAFERLTAPPVLADQRRGLTLFNARANGWTPAIGEPRHYWLENLSAALGGAPRFVMRLYPAPDRAYNLRLSLSFWAQRLALTDLMTPTALRVPDEFYESAYLPLCLGCLTSSPAWTDASKKREILALAETARLHLLGQPGQAGVPRNRVLTPAGY